MNIATTLFINNQNDSYKTLDKCHDGEGTFQLKNIIGKVKDKQFIKFIHDDIISPGSTFGYHQHKSDEPLEEWYFCLSGHGVMTLDGTDYDMNPGDIGVCNANGSHGLKNTGDDDLRIIVIYAAPITE